MQLVHAKKGLKRSEQSLFLIGYGLLFGLLFAVVAVAFAFWLQWLWHELHWEYCESVP